MEKTNGFETFHPCSEVVVRLDISYICMGVWVCTDDNYGGEASDPWGHGNSPKEAVLAYFDAKAEEIKNRTSAV